MDKRHGLVWIGAIVFEVLSVSTSSAAFAAEPLPIVAVNAGKPDAGKANLLLAEAERLRVAGKFQAALPFAQQAVALREKLLGPNHAEVGRALHVLGVLFRENGQYPDAEKHIVRALHVLEQATGVEPKEIASSLNELGDVYWYNGDSDRAEPHYQRALDIHEKSLGLDHPDVALSLFNLALLDRACGNYARAEARYTRALAIWEISPGSHSDQVADGLDSLAGVYHDMGDYAKAGPMFLRALAINEELHGKDHPRIAYSLIRQTTLYMLRGDFPRAEAINERAITILETTVGQNHPKLAHALLYRAKLCQIRGDYKCAKSASKRSADIWEKTIGVDHPHTCYAMLEVARIHQEGGNNSLAKTIILRSLHTLENKLGKTHHVVGVALTALAEVYQAEGNYDGAGALLERTLALYEPNFGNNHPTVAITLNAFTSLYIAQHRFADAHVTAERATAIQDINAHSQLSTGSEDQKRLYMQTLRAQTAQNIALHVEHDSQNPAAARLALTTLLRRKGLVLDVMTDSLAALKRSLSPNDQALLEQLTTVYSQIATQASRGPCKMLPEQYRKNLADLEQSRQSLESNIAKQSAAFRADHHVTLEAVQAAVPKDAVLLEIARVTPTQAKPSYVAYLLRPTGDPTFANLGDAEIIDAAITTFRAALSDPDHTHDPKPAARALDQLLMQPIRNVLGDTHWIFVSPDGPLHLVPFAALVDESGHYLVEKYLFSYLTSGRDLLRYEDNTTLPSSAPLIVANPAFNESNAPKTPEGKVRGLRSIDMFPQPLPSLESTLEEAHTIAALFPESRILLGKDATEEAVKDAQSPKILHLATHGFFLPEQPIPSSLLTPRTEIPSAAEQSALAFRENPLLRSGIALAGFNPRQSGKDDGVLTALEVMGLNLHGTRLAVLSTCESGLGDARIGEGVYGLRRALILAGAETQVMSLWSVDTVHTGRLMQAYYRALRNGIGRSQAMRDVQLAMLRQTDSNHPNLWASFIVSGQWRPLEKPAPLPARQTTLPWIALGLLATIGFQSRNTSKTHRTYGESMRRFAIALVIIPVLAMLYAYAEASPTSRTPSSEACPILDPGPPPVCPAGCAWDGQECRIHSGIIMPDNPDKVVGDGGP